MKQSNIFSTFKGWRNSTIAHKMLKMSTIGTTIYPIFWKDTSLIKCNSTPHNEKTIIGNMRWRQVCFGELYFR